MLTLGSIERDTAAAAFPFLSSQFRGRRRAIKDFTHRDPDFVFWIHPDGRLHDAKDAHAKNVPKGYEHIVHDEPDYGGFLRGRIASDANGQLIVVYCRAEALATSGVKLAQFVEGIHQVPVPVDGDALVISDNGDIYGTLADVVDRSSA